MHGAVGERARVSAVHPRGGLMADGTKCGSRGGPQSESDDLGGHGDGGDIEVGKKRRDRARHDGHPAERESGVRYSNRRSSPTLRKNQFSIGVYSSITLRKNHFLIGVYGSACGH